MKKAVILDTNVFMHFEALNSIDWLKMMGAEHVRLIVPQKVVEELDVHKDSHPKLHMKRRARESLQLIEKVFDADGEVTANVTLDVRDAPLDFDYKRYGLNPDVADDVILATTLSLEEDFSDINLKFLSNDTGPRLKAKRLGLDAEAPPDQYQLKAELSPEEREIRELTKRLQRLEGTRPKIRLRFKRGEEFASYLSLQIQPPVIPDEGRLTELVGRQRSRYPKLEKASDELEGFAGLAPASILTGFGSLSDSHTDVDVERYNRQLDSYFSQYRWHLTERARYENRMRLTNALELIIENVGTAPTSVIDVHLHFPDGFTLSSSPLEPPEALSPPNKPRTQREQTLSGNGILDILQQSSSSIRDVPTPAFGPPTGIYDLDIKKTNSYDVKFKVEPLKHGMHQARTFYLTFDSFDAASGFSINYKVYIAELPDPVTGQLNVTVEKAA